VRQRYKKPNIVYEGFRKASLILDRFLKDKRLLLLLLLSGLLFLFVIIRFESLFFTALLIGLGAVSMLYQRYFKSPVGIELCMMATVLTSLVYGPHYGVFTGFASISAALILSGSFKHSSFVSVFTLPLIGLIVPFFRDMPLLYLGLLMTVLYDAVILPVYIMLGSRVVSSIIFFATHVLFNYWVFSTIAPFIRSLMG
jgi:hypothetical protein